MIFSFLATGNCHAPYLFDCIFHPFPLLILNHPKYKSPTLPNIFCRPVSRLPHNSIVHLRDCSNQGLHLQ